MILSHYVQLKECFDHWGQATFDEIFLDELQQHSYDLPLQNFCHEGGWPDDESLQLKIESIDESTDGRLVVEVERWFVEVIPSSCADITTERDRMGSFEIVLHLETREAEFSEDTDG